MKEKIIEKYKKKNYIKLKNFFIVKILIKLYVKI